MNIRFHVHSLNSSNHAQFTNKLTKYQKSCEINEEAIKRRQDVRISTNCTSTVKAKNDAFSRARRDLVAKGFIVADNDYYTLSDKATLGDNQQNVARQNLHDGDATDTPF